MFQKSKFDFQHDILKSRKYLIVNKIGVFNDYFRYLFLIIILIQKGFIISIILPMILTIIPAIINWTQQEWLYGIFFVGSIIGLLYRKFIYIDKEHILSKVVSALKSNKHADHNINDRFTKTEEGVSINILKESRKEIERYASSLPDGNLRNELKLHWIEPITGFLVILYFFFNPELTITSKEYYNFLLALAFVTIDIVVNGFFSSFNDFIKWIPRIDTGANNKEIIIVGLLRFFIVLFLTKFIIEKCKLLFSKKIWFEGNPIGLSIFIKKYLNSFSDMEGCLIIYDFGIREDFGQNRASIILNSSVKNRSKELIDEIIKLNINDLEGLDLKKINPDFDEAQNINIILDNNEFFQDGNIGIDISIGDNWPSIYHYNRLILSNVKKLRYDIKEQKLYFIVTDNREIDSGIVILFPMSLIIQASERVNFVLVNENGLSPPTTFPLNNDHDKTLSARVFRKIIWSLPRKKF